MLLSQDRMEVPLICSQHKHRMEIRTGSSQRNEEGKNFLPFSGIEHRSRVCLPSRLTFLQARAGLEQPITDVQQFCLLLTFRHRASYI